MKQWYLQDVVFRLVKQLCPQLLDHERIENFEEGMSQSLSSLGIPLLNEEAEFILKGGRDEGGRRREGERGEGQKGKRGGGRVEGERREGRGGWK